MDDRYYEWLQELQTMDFSLYEMTLYLDTHPYDRAVMEQYNQLAQNRKQFAEQFEEYYGPLLHGKSFSRLPWQWVESPWPWQV